MMSNQKQLTSLLLLLCVLLLECKKEPDQLPEDKDILGNIVKPASTDEYIYPIQPGTIGWDTVQIHGNLYDMIQIPDTVIKKISTWGLIETCFRYPLRGDCSFWNIPSIWINNVSTNYFNGLIELFSRDDVVEKLLYEYRYLDLKKYSYWNDCRYIEMVVGCDAFMSKLNAKQLLYLTWVAIEKSGEQRALFESSVYPQSLFVMGNAMVHAGYKPFIDYCDSNNISVTPGYNYIILGIDYNSIEKYANDFVYN